MALRVLTGSHNAQEDGDAEEWEQFLLYIGVPGNLYDQDR